jgi:GT2 family glycosyltransferase
MGSSPPPKVSVIIVNYNSREFILLALESLFRAARHTATEIIVVDNASTDESVEQIGNIFPEVQLIKNTKNLGFAAANNIGIKQSAGEYILLINPDTVVPENLFEKMIRFMQQTPDAGAMGCKILNADGSFSVDSRHSVPSPVTALWRQLGLDRFFPKSRIFGRYNLTYLDPDKTYPVDAVSGSFMFIRRTAVEKTGLLDEDYFMYCEDVDYCYRLNRSGWKVYYYPEISILHFKGESTPGNSFRYSRIFSHSLYLFYRKHFHRRYGLILHGLIILGVLLRAILVYLKNNLKHLFNCIYYVFHRSALHTKNAIWVGSAENLAGAREKILRSGYSIIGMITTESRNEMNRAADLADLGSISNLAEFIPLPDARKVIYSVKDVDYKTIISLISDLHRFKLDNKILPLKSAQLVGKSMV